MPHLPGDHVLVVEDNPVFRQFLLSWLSRHFKVRAVRDGLEALRWLQAGNVPSAVLLDLELPRISGLQVLRNLRRSGLFRDLPVVALSSLPEEDPTLATARTLGVDGMFSKPYAPSELLACLRAAAISRQTATHNRAIAA